MSQKKKIMFISGALLLALLSFILIVLYETDPLQESHSSPIRETRDVDETDLGSGNLDNIDMSEGDLDDAESAIGNNNLEEEELRSYAKEAIEKVNLSSNITEPNERSFFEHARLNQYYISLMGNRLSEDEGMEEEANWVAKEFMAWMYVARETAGFQYSQDQFIQFVEDNKFIEEDDIRTIVLLEELKTHSQTLYIRHLEYSYIKPYIWQSVQDVYMEQQHQNQDESDEEHIFRMYSEFESKVMEHLVQQYPELLDEN